MYWRRKHRNKIIIAVVLIVGFVFWRGFTATTSASFTCEYKLIYAACVPKNSKAKLPGLVQIFKAGVKF
jgi:hypothetical protein